MSRITITAPVPNDARKALAKELGFSCGRQGVDTHIYTQDQKVVLIIFNWVFDFELDIHHNAIRPCRANRVPPMLVEQAS